MCKGLNILSIVMVLVLSAVFLCGRPDYLMEKGWLTALTYSFHHANIFHLALNAWVLVSIFRYADNRRFCKEMALAYIISVAVLPFSIKPIVGISNMIYAVLGMRTPPLSHPWWKRRNTIMFLVITLLMVFIPSISATTHLVSFATGAIIAMVMRKVKEIDKDAERVI